MFTFIRTMLVLAVTSLLVACGGKESPVAPAITKNDKMLSCDELQLEINDAEFFRNEATNNKSLNLSNIIWPLGYPATYNNAEEAISASNARIAYLTKVYEIKKCNSPLK